MARRPTLSAIRIATSPTTTRVRFTSARLARAPAATPSPRGREICARSLPAAVDDLVEVAREPAESRRAERPRELAARQVLGLRDRVERPRAGAARHGTAAGARVSSSPRFSASSASARAVRDRAPLGVRRARIRSTTMPRCWRSEPRGHERRREPRRARRVPRGGRSRRPGSGRQASRRTPERLEPAAEPVEQPAKRTRRTGLARTAAVQDLAASARSRVGEIATARPEPASAAGAARARRPAPRPAPRGDRPAVRRRDRSRAAAASAAGSSAARSGERAHFCAGRVAGPRGRSNEEDRVPRARRRVLSLVASLAAWLPAGRRRPEWRLLVREVVGAGLQILVAERCRRRARPRIDADLLRPAAGGRTPPCARAGRSRGR